MRRKRKGDEEEFNSFIDIMTCLAGILMLIILLVIVQVQEVRVVIPTPLEYTAGKAPLFIECRSNMLFEVDLPRIKERVEETMKELSAASQVNGQMDRNRFLRDIGRTEVLEGPYKVDLQFALLGQFAVRPNSSVFGYEIEGINEELDNGGWYLDKLSNVDKEREMLTFIVRDDSFEVFRKARSIAWVKEVEASWYLVPSDEPIKFGLTGEAPIAQ